MAKKFRIADIGGPIMNEEAAMKMSPLTKNSITVGPEKAIVGKIDKESGLLSNLQQRQHLPDELLQEIQKFQMKGFAEKHFSLHRKIFKFWKRPMKVETVTSWSKEKLTCPLLANLPNSSLSLKNVHKEALATFSLIQYIMGDRPDINIKGVHSQLTALQSLMSKGVLHPVLRDEIYVQICKQTSKNPNQESLLQGWLTIALASRLFPPSRNLEAFVKNYMESSFLKNNRVSICSETMVKKTDELIEEYVQDCLASGNSVYLIDELARFSHKRLTQICETGARSRAPTLKEIEHALWSPFVPSVFGSSLESIAKMQGGMVSVDIQLDSHQAGCRDSTITYDVVEEIPALVFDGESYGSDIYESCSEGVSDDDNESNENVDDMLYKICFSKQYPDKKKDMKVTTKRKHDSRRNSEEYGAKDGWITVKVPAVLKLLVDAIEKLDGFTSQGIFRVPGDSEEVNILKLQLEKGKFSAIQDVLDPNVCASVLKLFLRQLEHPLIPDHLYQRCVECCKDVIIQNDTVAPEDLEMLSVETKKITNELPEYNRNVVLYVIHFLSRLSAEEFQKYTKMTKKNLAMVFAPSFLRCHADNPLVILQNAKPEQTFLLSLMQNPLTNMMKGSTNRLPY
eukprot:Nk52_evm58s1073 gene=Nk52_evmTU58s1073